MESTLSVIIPIRNKANTLPRLIEAIGVQQISRELVEIIFVIDNCTDESSSVIESAHFPFAKSILQTSAVSSAANARNLGLAHSTCEYCLFLDADIVIPPDFFFKVLKHFKLSKNTILLGPVYGNSSSIGIWPFIVDDHRAIFEMPRSHLLTWAEAQPHLRDFRMQIADLAGSLNHLPAPWVLCWSSAMAVDRHLLNQIGGFDASLLSKGSEDLELGYRCWRLGCQFRLMRDTYVLHFPHERKRDSEERNDCLHEREMLKLHPTCEMEALCAFGGDHANTMLTMLQAIDSCTIERTTDLLKTAAPIMSRILPSSIDLCLGPPPTRLLDAIHIDHVVCPWLTMHDKIDGRHWPFFGFSLPFEDRLFKATAIMGTWQLLPERLACRLIQEALRVSGEVFLLKSTEVHGLKPAWDDTLLAVHDAPYWERTAPLKRSYFDFTLNLVEWVPPIGVFRVGLS